MENKNHEMSPQELLKQLKESISDKTGQSGEQNAADEEIMQSNFAPPPAEPTEPEVGKIRYRFSVQRPMPNPAPEAKQEQQISVPPAPSFSLKTETDIPFEAVDSGSVQDVIGTLLSQEEIAAMEHFGALPDAREIAEQAKKEAEYAYEAGEIPQSQPAAEGQQTDGQQTDGQQTDGQQTNGLPENSIRQEADQTQEMPEQEMTLTDEVEVVYADAAEYYDHINSEGEPVPDEPAAEIFEEQLCPETDELLEEISIPAQSAPMEPVPTEQPDVQTVIQPDEKSKRNVFNFISSLTKKAAARSADAAASAAAILPDESAFSAAESAQNDQSGGEAEPVSPTTVSGGEEADSVHPEKTAAEFDAVDVNLMIAFGMEDKLKDAIGEEETEKVSQQVEEDAKTMTSTDIFKAVSEEVKPVQEFTDYSQAKGIFAKYKARYRALLLKLAASVLLTVLLFFFENITALGGALPKGISPDYYPVVNIMVGLQLSLFTYALVWGQMKRGVAAMLRGQLIPESATAFIVAISLLYQVFIAVFCRVNYITYNFPVSLCLFFSLAYEFMNLKREMYSFNIVASKKMKYALCALTDEERARESAAFRSYFEADSGEQEPTGDVTEQEPTGQEAPEVEHSSPAFLDGPMVKLKRGAFLDGFFEKMERYPASKSILKLLVPAMGVLSLLFCIVGFARTASFASGVSLGFFALAVCAPGAMFITYSYPLYKASKQAFANESAIIGEKTVEEYLDASVITFEDKDIFPTKGVKVKSIKVYGSHRIDRVVFNAANIFRKYGGPLSQVFNMATLELGTTDEVYFGVIEDDGIEAMVAGSHIYIGKTDYLRRKGYNPGFDDEDEVIEGNGGICIMFMAIEDEVAAKFYVEYSIDHEFEDILRNLYSAGVCISIRTFDPNIDDRMLNLLLRYDQYPVKVIKCRTDDQVDLAKEHLDSGIVSKRSVKDMLRAFMSCERVLRSVKMGVIVKMTAMGVGALFTLLLVILNAGGAVSSMYAGLYQLFWTAALALVVKMIV